MPTMDTFDIRLFWGPTHSATDGFKVILKYQDADQNWLSCTTPEIAYTATAAQFAAAFDDCMNLVSSGNKRRFHT